MVLVLLWLYFSGLTSTSWRCLFTNSSDLRGKSFPWCLHGSPCTDHAHRHMCITICVFFLRNSGLHIYVCDARNTTTSLSKLQFPLSRFHFPTFSFFLLIFCFSFCLILFSRQGLMYAKLSFNLLCSRDGIECLIFLYLLYKCWDYRHATISGLFYTRDWAQGSVF